MKRYLQPVKAALAAYGRRLASFAEALAHDPAAEFRPGIAAVMDARPPKIVWALPSLLMLLLAIGLIWATVSKIDIVAPSTGRTIPGGRVKVIQPSGGFVVQAINVSEGDRVKAGQTLVEFDNTAVLADLEQTVGQLVSLKLEEARLNAQLSGAQLSGEDEEPGAFLPPGEADEERIAAEHALMLSEWSAYRGSLIQQDRRIDNLRASAESLKAQADQTRALLPFAEKKVERYRALAAKGNTTAANLEEASEALVERREGLRVSEVQYRAALAEVKVAEAEREGTMREFKVGKLQRLAEVRQTIAGLEDERRKLENQLALTKLASPIDGIVFDLAIHTVGGVVQPAQELMKIVPAESRMVVEAKVLNRDVGFIHEGMPVQVKFETFSFTKYGSVPGRITQIAGDMTLDERLGPIYRTTVELDRDWMMVEGRRVRLFPGMSVTVDMHTGERRLIEYILTPLLKYKSEALRER